MPRPFLRYTPPFHATDFTENSGFYTSDVMRPGDDGMILLMNGNHDDTEAEQSAIEIWQRDYAHIEVAVPPEADLDIAIKSNFRTPLEAELSVTTPTAKIALTLFRIGEFPSHDEMLRGHLAAHLIWALVEWWSALPEGKWGFVQCNVLWVESIDTKDAGGDRNAIAETLIHLRDCWINDGIVGLKCGHPYDFLPGFDVVHDSGTGHSFLYYGDSFRARRQ